MKQHARSHSPAVAVTTVPLKAYSKKELMHLYHIPEKTFRRWMGGIKDITGARNGRYYTIRQVELIFEYLGAPPVAA